MQFKPNTHNPNAISNNDSNKKNQRTVGEILKIGWSIFGMVAITLVGGLSFFKWYFPDGGIPAENLLALLSFLLAFFSIGLSVFFYFQADKSANSFYDNSYKFTKEMSELLGRIEAGFGEKLNNIQQSNIELRNKIDIPKKAEEEIKKQINKNNKKISDIEESKDKYIDEMLDKTNLMKEDKDIFKQQFNSYNESFEAIMQENDTLKNLLSALSYFEDEATARFFYEKYEEVMGKPFHIEDLSRAVG